MITYTLNSIEIHNFFHRKIYRTFFRNFHVNPNPTSLNSTQHAHKRKKKEQTRPEHENFA